MCCTSLIDALVMLLGLLFIYLTCMVAVVQFKGDTSIANFTWGGGVMLVALYTFFVFSAFLPQQILMTALMVLWAMRLIMYVYLRYTGKDPRFAAWKWQGFKALCINICWVFGQLIMIAIMSYPVFAVNGNNIPRGITMLDLFGLAIWLCGYCYEAISDYQLFVFMHNPANRGRVMQSGLWHYSRHPNYFGEILIWWGVFFIAFATPYIPRSLLFSLSFLITPVTITCLLVFVTGIPWIEKTMINNPEYQQYKRKTSMLIPWFVKK